MAPAVVTAPRGPDHEEVKLRGRHQSTPLGTQLAFAAARSRVHDDKHIASGVFKLLDENRAQRIATAGYARLVTRMAVGSAGFEESLALAGAL